ncbi:hypothetical protein ACFYVL_31795 [Streptomyces sp. NPDC004111]|uniref:hypothetical protein n=1 Tax=Streptomyces sp. NPDC004111 TaxID=3364690 RepID=UPI0036B34D34
MTIHVSAAVRAVIGEPNADDIVATPPEGPHQCRVCGQDLRLVEEDISLSTLRHSILADEVPIHFMLFSHARCAGSAILTDEEIAAEAREPSPDGRVPGGLVVFAMGRWHGRADGSLPDALVQEIIQKSSKKSPTPGPDSTPDASTGPRGFKEPADLYSNDAPDGLAEDEILSALGLISYAAEGWYRGDTVEAIKLRKRAEVEYPNAYSYLTGGELPKVVGNPQHSGYNDWSRLAHDRAFQFLLDKRYPESPPRPWPPFLSWRRWVRRRNMREEAERRAELHRELNQRVEAEKNGLRIERADRRHQRFLREEHAPVMARICEHLSKPNNWRDGVITTEEVFVAAKAYLGANLEPLAIKLYRAFEARRGNQDWEQRVKDVGREAGQAGGCLLMMVIAYRANVLMKEHDPMLLGGATPVQWCDRLWSGICGWM